MEKTLCGIAELTKNCEIGNFVKKKSHIVILKGLMCNTFKIKSLLHKLTLDRAAGKDGIFA